jgi:hypothetical protein
MLTYGKIHFYYVFLRLKKNQNLGVGSGVEPEFVLSITDLCPVTYPPQNRNVLVCGP